MGLSGGGLRTGPAGVGSLRSPRQSGSGAVRGGKGSSLTAKDALGVGTGIQSGATPQGGRGRRLRRGSQETAMEFRLRQSLERTEAEVVRDGRRRMSGQAMISAQSAGQG